MKKTILTILSAIIAISSISVFDAKADGGLDILERVMETVELLEDADYSLACVMIDQLTSSSDTRTLTRHLYAGNEYMAIAEGDTRIKDTDLTIYKKLGEEWVVVDHDSDTSNVAVVSFDCTETGDYKFEVSAYSFADGHSVALYGLTIAFD